MDDELDRAAKKHRLQQRHGALRVPWSNFEWVVDRAMTLEVRKGHFQQVIVNIVFGNSRMALSQPNFCEFLLQHSRKKHGVQVWSSTTEMVVHKEKDCRANYGRCEKHSDDLPSSKHCWMNGQTWMLDLDYCTVGDSPWNEWGGQ